MAINDLFEQGCFTLSQIASSAAHRQFLLAGIDSAAAWAAAD
jgi:hypothetical protein